jgi:glutathione S-transferase
MLDNDELTAEDIARKAMKIAGDLCVYTNHNTIVEVIDAVQPDDVEKPLLGYWHARGKAAPIKYLLGYLGVEFRQDEY